MQRFLPRRVIRRVKYRSPGSQLPGDLLFGLATLVVLGIGTSAYWRDPRTPVLGGLLTGTIAALSIIFSVSRTRAQSRDQYTLSLVAARFDRVDYLENARIVDEHVKAGTIADTTTLAQLLAIAPDTAATGYKERDKPVFYAVVLLLNYWEHVCTAYVDDRINRRIFEDLVQDLIREMVARHACVIGDMRNEDGTNLEHLCAVWFALATEEERRSLTARLGAVPPRLCPADQGRWECLQARAEPAP